MNNIQDQKRFLGTKLVQSMMNQFQKKKDRYWWSIV